MEELKGKLDVEEIKEEKTQVEVEPNEENLAEVEQTNVEELGLYKIKETFEKEIDETKTKFYYGSLRSGQKMEYNGSIVIIGEVNAGAEVFAGENIMVLGELRGMAHAGATGNKKAIISAMGINSPQIRIANIVKEMGQETSQKRQIAAVKENEINIETA